jgi:hypothetical protein
MRKTVYGVPRAVVDNLKTPLVHLLKVEGCLVHIVVTQTPKFPAYAGLVSVDLCHPLWDQGILSAVPLVG